MQYDAAGNLTNDGGQQFTYDALGKQVWASATGLSQSYDGDGMRVKKVEQGVATYYVRSSVLGGQVICEINGWGGWTRGYVYLGGQLLAIQDGSVVYVHQDPITKSQRLTDTAGNVVSGVELDPWGGETTRSWNQGRQPHQYTTYERDQNGSDDAQARRYNRWWSRFDQPDPFDGSYDLSDPQSFNRYSYCYNDPVNHVDPDGEIPILAMAVGAATSVATGWAIAKLTGQEYGWQDAAIDAGTGAIGAGLASKAQTLWRVSQLRGVAQAQGLTKQASKVETWKNGIEMLKIKLQGSMRPGLQAGSQVPRFEYRISEGLFMNPFTGQIGGAGALSHIPLEVPLAPGVPGLIGGATGAAGSTVRGALNGGERPDRFDERADALRRSSRRWSAADQAFWNLGMMSMMFDRMRTVNMGNMGTINVSANGSRSDQGPPMKLPR